MITREERIALHQQLQNMRADDKLSQQARKEYFCQEGYEPSRRSRASGFNENEDYWEE